MASQEEQVVFKAPRYSSQSGSEQVALSDVQGLRKRRESSVESSSPLRRKWPSLAAQGGKRPSGESLEHRLSVTSESSAAGSGTDSNATTLVSARRSTDTSRISSHIKQLRQSVDTQDVLMNFSPIAREYWQKEREREARLEKHKHPYPFLEDQLKRLKTEKFASRTWTQSLFANLYLNKPANIIKEIDLSSIAKAYFPPRSELRVYITDFRRHSAESYECRLSEITSYWQSKPADVQVRWIHAPLGLGPLHSTLEDIFLHVGPLGRPFNNLGRSSFPYAKLEVLNFCDRERFQKMRDVYHLLHDNESIAKELKRACWTGFVPTSESEGRGLLDDLKWRSTHLGLTEDWATLPDFWSASNSDIPWQLTEGPAMSIYGPLDGLFPTLWQSDKQALHKHKFFGSAQLVRDIFRCLHRADG